MVNSWFYKFFFKYIFIIYLFIDDDDSQASRGGNGCDSDDISNGKYFIRLNYLLTYIISSIQIFEFIYYIVHITVLVYQFFLYNTLLLSFKLEAVSLLLLSYWLLYTSLLSIKIKLKICEYLFNKNVFRNMIFLYRLIWFTNICCYFIAIPPISIFFFLWLGNFMEIPNPNTLWKAKQLYNQYWNVRTSILNMTILAFLIQA